MTLLKPGRGGTLRVWQNKAIIGFGSWQRCDKKSAR